jgi:hypothetical protein
MAPSAPALAAAALLLAGAGSVVADEFASRDDAKPIRVYTNADIEALEPIPTQPGAAPTADEIAERWEFVQSVLDQGYARIDAGRRHELERRMTDARSDALDRIDSRPRYVLPYGYYGYYGRQAPRYTQDGYDRGHPAASLLWERPNAELFRPITPIHARPYASNLFRFEARRGGPPPAPAATPHGRR